MAIYLNRETRIIVQGITGSVGSTQAKLTKDYGSDIVGGVAPGKGGREVHGLPVFDSVADAVEMTQANASVIFVPASAVSEAAHSALDAGLELVVIITEHVPVKESLDIQLHARECGAVVIGPNCPGLLTPGVGRMGIIPGHVATPGKVGVVSRSGTLAFEVAADLTDAGIGQSTIVGIGGDVAPCTSLLEVLSQFEEDPSTEAVVIVGEVGGSSEEQAAEYIKKAMKKPVFAFIAGRCAPPGKKMGHAGAIVRGKAGTAAHKVRALEDAGVAVARNPIQLPGLINARLGRRNSR